MTKEVPNMTKEVRKSDSITVLAVIVVVMALGVLVWIYQSY